MAGACGRNLARFADKMRAAHAMLANHVEASRRLLGHEPMARFCCELGLAGMAAQVLIGVVARRRANLVAPWACTFSFPACCFARPKSAPARRRARILS